MDYGFLPPPRIRNSILEGNDGISAELLWHGQTGCTALSLALLVLVDGHRVR